MVSTIPPFGVVASSSSSGKLSKLDMLATLMRFPAAPKYEPPLSAIE